MLISDRIAVVRVSRVYKVIVMDDEPVVLAQTWRTTHGDMTDEEWELLADLVAPWWSPGKMGRPVKVSRRAVVDAIF